jgi:hypothetical protein
VFLIVLLVWFLAGQFAHSAALLVAIAIISVLTTKRESNDEASFKCNINLQTADGITHTSEKASTFYTGLHTKGRSTAHRLLRRLATDSRSLDRTDLKFVVMTIGYLPVAAQE